jgi:hypothetical protein
MFWILFFSHQSKSLGAIFFFYTFSQVSDLIQIELAYINTNHPDFIGGSRAVAQLMEKRQEKPVALKPEESAKVSIASLGLSLIAYLSVYNIYFNICRSPLKSVLRLLQSKPGLCNQLHPQTLQLLRDRMGVADSCRLSSEHHQQDLQIS